MCVPPSDCARLLVLFERVCLSRMATTSNDYDVSNDTDTLTVMNEDEEREASSPSDARYHRDVSRIPKDSPAEY